MRKTGIMLIIVLLVFSACTSGERVEVQETVSEEQEKPAIDTTPQTIQSSVKDFKVVIGHTFYDPNSFTVKKGDTIRFSAVVAPGTSSHMHGVTIDEFGVNEAVTTTDTSNPKIVEFVPDMTGIFSIWCKTCWDGPFGTAHPDIRATLVVEE